MNGIGAIVGGQKAMAAYRAVINKARRVWLRWPCLIRTIAGRRMRSPPSPGSASLFMSKEKYVESGNWTVTAQRLRTAFRGAEFDARDA